MGVSPLAPASPPAPASAAPSVAPASPTVGTLKLALPPAPLPVAVFAPDPFAPAFEESPLSGRSGWGLSVQAVLASANNHHLCHRNRIAAISGSTLQAKAEAHAKPHDSPSADGTAWHRPRQRDQPSVMEPRALPAPASEAAPASPAAPSPSVTPGPPAAFAAPPAPPIVTPV
jgi:hypothetical protein